MTLTALLPEYTALHDSVRNDDVRAVSQIVLTNSWINVKFPRYITDTDMILRHHCPVLGLAAYVGAIDVFRFLIANGANAKALDERQVTISEFACAGGQIDILEFMFESYIHTEEDAPRCLSEAAKHKRNDIIDMIFELFPKVQVTWSSPSVPQPIHSAALNGNLELVKRLLAHGANINATMENVRRTALHCACIQEKTECLEFLLQQPTLDKTIRSALGETPLMVACAVGRLENAKMLLKYTPDLDLAAVDTTGSTALHIAALNNQIEVVKFLLGLPNIDVNALNSVEKTPLMLAVEMGHVEMREILLKAGEPLIKSPTQSLVELARMVGDEEFAERLIKEYHADPTPVKKPDPQNQRMSTDE